MAQGGESFYMPGKQGTLAGTPEAQKERLEGAQIDIK
jgi:hypothetical protein